MDELSPWENSDIKLQNVMIESEIKRRKYYKKSVSEGQIRQMAMDYTPYYKNIRSKTSCLAPIDTSFKLIEVIKRPVATTEQSIGLSLNKNQAFRQISIKRKDIQLLQRQRLRQRQIIKQQLASVFLRQQARRIKSVQQNECQQIRIRRHSQIFRPVNSSKFIKYTKQQSLVLPKIKIGNKYDKILRDRKYFFDEHSLFQNRSPK